MIKAMNFKMWLENINSDIVSLIKQEYVKIAQSVYNKSVKNGNVIGDNGLCDYIAEEVVSKFSNKFKNVDVSENHIHRNHTSILVVDHNTKTAYDLNIPEEKYQIYKNNNYLRKPNVIFNINDVIVTQLNYSIYDYNAPMTQLKSKFS